MKHFIGFIATDDMNHSLQLFFLYSISGKAFEKRLKCYQGRGRGDWGFKPPPGSV
jgi:hypothetical protein